MSRIDDLIAQLSPMGVPYVGITEVIDYIRGITYNKNDEVADGEVSVLRANNITLASNTLNLTDVKRVSGRVRIRDNQRLRSGDILICAGSGSKHHIGKVAYIDADRDETFGGFMAVIRTKDPARLDSRFVFHLLTGGGFSAYLGSALSTTTINNLNVGVMRGYRIPVPPLEVQREIVRILDQFTQLEAELEAELEARRAQYEHYRDQLLTFREAEGVTWVSLGEIGSIFGGLTGKSKSDFANGNARFVAYTNVFNNIAVDLCRDDRVHIGPGENQRALERGDILFTGSSETADEVAMSSVVVSKPEEATYLNSFSIGVRPRNSELLDPNFSKHLFRSGEMRRQLVSTASGVTRFNVSKRRLAKVLVPIPSLKRQKDIATSLDKFDALVNDLRAGLPAEIAARRKQYEYYRDKLLTFKEAF